MPSKRKTAEAGNKGERRASVATADSTADRAVSPAKRQRVSRACDQCRAAREKCDGIQPLCFPCVSQNRPCTYEANPKKRGVQTGYIRTLELTLAWLFEHVPGCEKALENFITHDGGQGRRLLVGGKESDKANRLHKRWRKSRVHKEVDRILSTDSGEASRQRAEKSSSGDDTETELCLDGNSDGRPTAGDTASPAPPSGTTNASQLTYEDYPARETMPLKLPPNHWRLLDIYFSYTHCWFPILEKQDLLKTVYLYGTEGIAPSSLSSAAHAELWSVLALASFQDSASSKPSVSSRVFSENSPQEVHYSPRLPHEIYDVARRLIPSEDGPFQFQHARALLLLTLVNIGRRNNTAAWILLGLAKHIALDSDGGLNRPHGHDRQQRKIHAVLIGCSVLETMISTLRRSSISNGLALLDAYNSSVPEDELDEWQPWTPCEGFGQDEYVSAASSRTPAYSLTSFNQLHDVFKFLRRNMTTSRASADAMRPEDPRRLVVRLHQVVRPGLPFSSFMTSEDSIPATVPPAYILQFIFLWTNALLCTMDDAPYHLLIESLEQFVAHFGACGAPSFLAPCLAMLMEHPSFDRLHQHDKDRWRALNDSLSAVWTLADDKRTGHPRSAASQTPTAPILYGPTNPSFAFSSPALPDSYGSHAAFGVRPLTSHQHHYPVADTSFIVGNYTQPKPTSPDTAPSVPSGMSILGTPTSSMHSGPGPPLGFQRPVRQSFSGGSLDYDALLDDLASIDYTDRVDADMEPQFMANLGFAPGCDIPEILAREFGGV